MSDDDLRPSWLHGACPPWCTRDHREGDHPEDRRHQDDGTTFTALLGVVNATTLRTEAIAGEVVVQRYQEIDETAAWVVIREAESAAGLIVLSEAAIPLLNSALREAS